MYYISFVISNCVTEKCLWRKSWRKSSQCKSVEAFLEQARCWWIQEIIEKGSIWLEQAKPAIHCQSDFGLYDYPAAPSFLCNQKVFLSFLYSYLCRFLQFQSMIDSILNCALGEAILILTFEQRKRVNIPSMKILFPLCLSIRIALSCYPVVFLQYLPTAKSESYCL